GESTNSSAGFHFWGHAPKNGTLRKLQISSENQFTQNTLHSQNRLRLAFIVHRYKNLPRMHEWRCAWQLT
ncbi:MAG: hypothetical protein J0L99_16515, partial [Chitinophagales bacterium]|nr:hypothetical protein [Chitinophagales bacterium]